MRVEPRNLFAIQLADQNVGQRLQHRRRSALQQVTDPYVQPAIFKTDEAICVSKPAEFHA